MNANNDAARDALLERIARDVLLIETLDERRSDSLDFHDLSVVTVRKALLAAYEAGRALRGTGAQPRMPRSGR
jgi:hypothetical protein